MAATSSNNEVSSKSIKITDQLIMDEILPRLPVKHLTRFKLVSKLWNSTISSNEFAKLHLKLSSLNNYNRRFLFYSLTISHGDKNFYPYLLPYAERCNLSDLVKLDHIAELCKGDWLATVDSCNGLICLYQCAEGYNRRSFFTLWNPATRTREYRDIPLPEKIHFSDAHGFGYVSSLDDYFIVATLASATNRNDSSRYRGLYVYSLKAGKWERICGKFYYVQTSCGCRKWKRVRDPSNEDLLAESLACAAVMVGHTMFWGCIRIIGFDVVTKELKKYPRLEWQDQYGGMGWETKMRRVKGCLSFLCYKKNIVLDFWMLKNPSDWSSWQKTLSVDLTNIYFLAFSETGKCLVRQLEEFKLVDPCMEALESTKSNDNADFQQHELIKDHIESLVSPFRIAKDDEKEDNNENSKHHDTSSKLLDYKRVSSFHYCEDSDDTDDDDSDSDDDNDDDDDDDDDH